MLILNMVKRIIRFYQLSHVIMKIKWNKDNLLTGYVSKHSKKMYDLTAEKQRSAQ
jgi:hypothetical protein